MAKSRRLIAELDSDIRRPVSGPAPVATNPVVAKLTDAQRLVNQAHASLSTDADRILKDPAIRKYVEQIHQMAAMLNDRIDHLA